MDLSIKLISSFSIFLPLILAGIRYRTGDLNLRLFCVFLLVGAIVDFLGWVNFRTDFNVTTLMWVHLGYSFFEALFFTWISTVFLEKSVTKKIRLFLGVLFTLLFTIRLVLMLQPNPSYVLSPVVDSIYLITTAFLAGFSLLRIAEDTLDIFQESWFWILSGIFFYSFGTFFIDTLKGTEVLGDTWKIRNIINIIQYIFFVIGLMMIQNKRIL